MRFILYPVRIILQNKEEVNRLKVWELQIERKEILDFVVCSVDFTQLIHVLWRSVLVLRCLSAPFSQKYEICSC